MAGTVVDAVMATTAGATTGVNTGTPRTSGNLTVGIGSDVASMNGFCGALGKMDTAGFCVANAVYDPLFVSKSLPDGTATWSPMLAISATPDSKYTTWTVTLRQGVKFHDGTDFTADDVVGNFTAAYNNATVGQAIKPLIKSCTKVSTYVVKYVTVNPWTTFPLHLAEQQIAYMAAPSTLAGGTPVGTGPFAYHDWTFNQQSNWHKNGNYWRKDAASRSLPYQDSMTFKVIVDPQGRYTDLKNGSIDMMVNTDGSVIADMRSHGSGNIGNHGATFVDDQGAARDPSNNMLICNTTGKNFLGQTGAVNSSGTWDHSMTSVIADPNIRLACAYAINRPAVFSALDNGVGSISDGVYRSTSKYYPKGGSGYPAFSQTKAREAVAAWKKKNPKKTPSFVIDTVSGSAYQDAAFSLIQGMLAAVGITVTQRKKNQDALIADKIFKTYDCSTWSQFGGLDPSLNAVWFWAGGFVNFSNLSDKAVQTAMLDAMKSPAGSTAQKNDWAKVDTLFAKDLPYLWLDITVTAWAANNNVQNWAYATDANNTPCFNPDGGSTFWSQIWVTA